MGIAAAKVPSSSLDKISAEWLEEEIIKTNPGRRRPARAQARRGKTQARRRGKNPDHPRAANRRRNRRGSPKPEPVIAEETVAEAAPAPAIEISQPGCVPPPAPKPVPVVPPAPPKPQMGEKVGFIQLRTAPRFRAPRRTRARRSPPRPQTPVAARVSRSRRPLRPAAARGDGRGQFQQRGRDGRPLQNAQPRQARRAAGAENFTCRPTRRSSPSSRRSSSARWPMR